MKKVLVILMACVLCLGLVGSAFAYFTDTETASNNTFTAGYMDLLINNQNDPTGLITVSNMAPGKETGDYYINFKNAGSLDGTLSYDVGITGEPAEPETLRPDGTGSDVTANQYAAQVYITKLLWGGVDILAATVALADANTDGNLSLLELANYGVFSDTSETLAVGNTKQMTYRFTLNANAGDAYQGDGVIMSVTGTLTSN
jgi:predicted ribosomally synthesized peptide with SipW-like signal peptide